MKFNRTTNDRPGVVCHQRPGPCWKCVFQCLAPYWKCLRQRLAPCLRHVEPCCQHLAHRHEHLACHRGHLVPAPRLPSLYRRRPSPSHRRCVSSSAAPQMPSVLLLASICPISPGYPRCLCFPSTSSSTFLNSLSVKNVKLVAKSTHSIAHASLPLSRSQGSSVPQP